MGDLTWSNEKRRLSDLVPWENNPRQIRKAEAERLRQSLEEFGQIHPIAIAPDGTILDGHQRQQVWSATKRFGPDYEVDVRVASRPLTEREHQKLVAMLHAGAVGGWDWDALAGWDMGDLAAWGFDGDLLKAWNDDAANLREMLNAEGEPVDYDELWKGMPEFENEENFGAVKSLKVHFATEADIEAFAKLIGQTVNMNTTYIWYPKQVRENLKEYIAKDES